MCKRTFQQAVSCFRTKVAKTAILTMGLLVAGTALAEDEILELDPQHHCIWQLLQDLLDYLNNLIC
ncbi:MAG: hypothetical protein GY719_31965 [bacterium]|nr:hypothetical protein [bacterium]